MTLQLLIPLDGSQFAEQAIPFALELASHTHATIHLVKVHQPDTYELRDQERDYLAMIANTPELAASNPVTALVNGEVAPALDKYIRSCGIDLVVMSTHGRGGLSRAWYGSVADELVRTANVPVLLLRPEGAHSGEPHPHAGIRNILLPVDGSELSESLIKTAALIGGGTETRYTLLQVTPVLPPVGYADGIGIVTTPDLTSELHADAALHLEHLASTLRARGLIVETVVLAGVDVATEIRKFAAAHDIDLIAMVTHGRSGWKRLALGSVADMLLRGTCVPLLVLHPETNKLLTGTDDIIEARLATCG